MKPAHETPSSSDDVGAALHLVLEALGQEEMRIRKEGAEAMQAGEYGTASEVIDFAKRLLSFQGRVAELEKQWSELEDIRDCSTPAVQDIVGKRFFGRRASREITQHFTYCRFILEALVEANGRGRTKEIIDRVGEKMKSVLKPKDYEPHKSDGKQIRWRNAAQWARNLMVNGDGRMKKGSPEGIWEISDAGREWLAANGPNQIRH